jgi:hypothetical protein
MRTSLPRMLHTCKVRACSPLCAPFAGAYSAAYPVSSIVHSWRPLPPATRLVLSCGYAWRSQCCCSALVSWYPINCWLIASPGGGGAVVETARSRFDRSFSRSRLSSRFDRSFSRSACASNPSYVARPYGTSRRVVGHFARAVVRLSARLSGNPGAVVVTT